MSLNYRDVISNVSRLLRSRPLFDNIETRLTAKVPIVKFRHKYYQIEGDISIYNTLVNN